MNVSLLYITVCTSPSCFFFFFNDTATTEIYTLSLHDALPICSDEAVVHNGRRACGRTLGGRWNYRCSANDGRCRSEEHTSELQSHLNLVCRLLLEKKKIETWPLRT